MTSAADFAGSEFDWFAIDGEGAVALFATAGAGFIPEAVLAAHAEHEGLSQSIECPDWGTPAVWDAYANEGLYVFDWELHSGPYRRVRTPSKAMSADFHRRVTGITSLPRFPGRFSDSYEIAGDWHAA